LREKSEEKDVEVLNERVRKACLFILEVIDNDLLQRSGFEE